VGTIAQIIPLAEVVKEGKKKRREKFTNPLKDLQICTIQKKVLAELSRNQDGALGTPPAY